MTAHILPLAVSALVAAGLFAYAFVRSRTTYLREATDRGQGLVITVGKGRRFGEQGETVDLDGTLYEPVREQVSLWLADPPIFNDGALLPWADLKDERPDRLEEIPADLRELLDEAEELSGKVTSLRGIVANMTVAETNDRGAEVGRKAGIEEPGGTKLRINVDGEWAKYLELSGIWITGSGLAEWAGKWVAREHPDADDWEVEVLVANRRAGSTAEAETVAGEVFTWLETKEIAVGLRDETAELQRLGRRILDRIAEERGTAAQSGGPAPRGAASPAGTGTDGPAAADR